MQVLRTEGEHDCQTRNAIAECYVNGTYSKLFEFLDFHRRGSLSITFWDACTEAALSAARSAAARELARNTKVEASAARLAPVMLESASEAARRSIRNEHTINEDLAQLPRWLPPMPGNWCAPVQAALCCSCHANTSVLLLCCHANTSVLLRHMRQHRETGCMFARRDDSKAHVK